MALPILTTGNPKLDKGKKFGYLSTGISFAPASLSGRNVCPGSSTGCRAVCLNGVGRGVYPRVQQQRIKKTNWFFNDREGFMAQLIKDIQATIRKAGRMSLKVSVRLNIYSDVQWENIQYQGKTIFEHFPSVKFLDYTKIAKRMLPGAKALTFKNYHLTFSRSEENEEIAKLVARAGGNVAVVFDKLPKKFWGRKVIDGTLHDIRFLDPKKCVVGLLPKGKAKRDDSGFVVQTA